MNEVVNVYCGSPSGLRLVRSRTTDFFGYEYDPFSFRYRTSAASDHKNGSLLSKPAVSYLAVGGTAPCACFHTLDAKYILNGDSNPRFEMIEIRSGGVQLTTPHPGSGTPQMMYYSGSLDW